ncbi:hypothetical protein Osc1_15750 [Hominimerdicola sp. 21CYCFAH17_S]
MKLIIDRREGESFVCEDKIGNKVIIPCVQAQNAAEGDIIEYKNGVYTVLAEETAERRKKINRLLDSLWE